MTNDRERTHIRHGGRDTQQGEGNREGQIYHIRVKGYLDDSWSDWFEGLRITHDSDGATVLVGPVVDQAALHGVLGKIRDLGLTLICARQVAGERCPEARKEEGSGKKW